MMPMTLSQHALVRMQQRGIPELVLPLLLKFGRKEHDHRGGKLVYLTRSSREQIRKAAGKEEFRRIEPALDTYAVVDKSGVVLTVGHRTRRINRH